MTHFGTAASIIADVFEQVTRYGLQNWRLPRDRRDTHWISV